MSIDKKLDDTIEQEMVKITPDNFLRTGMSFTDYTGELSDTIGQAKEDKTPLVEAGLDWKFVIMASAYLGKVVDEHGERVASEGIEAEVEEQFQELMPKAWAFKKIIMVILRFIIARTKDDKVKRSYKIIKKGYGNIDACNDIIAGACTIKHNIDYLSQVRPGGKEVTEKDLYDAKALAHKLIDMRGEVTAAADDGSFHVDRVNKLLTLCILAQREIKLFAEIAFFDNQEHYDKHYASDRLREIRLNKEKEQNAPQTQDVVS